MSTVFRGKGSPEMREEYLDFINLVFGFNGHDSDFLKLLPKLYKAEYHPCEKNYIVTEDGKLKAAIGAYDSILDVAGETLKMRGIGNVAVHPYCRSKGYMIDCMERALHDMVEDDCDLSMLGGQRQRYMYFSYDAGGPEYCFSINGTNIRHNFRDIPLPKMDFVKIRDEDTELLGKIIRLHNTRPLKTIREDSMFLDIARSWSSELYAILKEDGAFAGYFIGELKELTLVDNTDFNHVIRNYVRQNGSINLGLPMWDRELIDAAFKICENVSADNSEHFTIFHYQKVVSAFLKFKASFESLADGECKLYIHGYAGDEKLRIAVKDNIPSVEPFEGEADMELSHLDAFSLLFGICSVQRDRLSPAVRSWFPLPLYIDSADHV